MLHIIDPDLIHALAEAEGVKPFEILRRLMDRQNRETWEQLQKAGACKKCRAISESA